MIINSENNYCFKRISEFDNLMILTATANKTDFEFEGKHYDVCSDGIYVQTLIDNRVLYRKNKGYICNNLIKYFRNS